MLSPERGQRKIYDLPYKLKSEPKCKSARESFSIKLLWDVESFKLPRQDINKKELRINIICKITERKCGNIVGTQSASLLSPLKEDTVVI